MGRQLLTAHKGFQFTQMYEWRDESDEPIDLTGYSVFAVIAVGDVVFELEEGSGITVVDDEGKITVELTEEQTDEFEEHFGVHELWVVTPDSDKLPPLLEGPFFVSM